MKKPCAIAVFLLFSLIANAGAVELRYCLEYQICGSAISRLLFFFPLRIYYDTSLAAYFTAATSPDGKTSFVLEKIPRSAYLLRTLGFSGKTLAILSADMEEARAKLYRENILAQWQKDAPEFAKRVKNVKQFPHLLIKTGDAGLSFSRDSEGRYGDFALNLENRYVYHPARTGIFFNIFPMLGELLEMLNHPFLPGMGIAQVRQFPVAWDGDALDFSAPMNRLGGQLEKIVRSLVTVEQKFPFRLKFRVHENGPEAVEICGEAHPDVPLWKNFMIREAFRRVRLRLADGTLLLDEIWVGIRNNKGQGGFGRLQLRLIDPLEENR
ncbi:MAG: hypothetical protein NTW95_15450 [Candidatus Aminicenantes bacterium]|nr:hypothetical protein [Candidatus Aminicenantes bacterium]